MSIYLFEKPLIRGTMLKRKSQFTALVDIDGEELVAHIPTTNRIGDVENKNLPCLLSYHDDPKRKLKYDIEAVLLSDDDNWIGINQILSNRLVEYFFNEHALDEIVSGQHIMKKYRKPSKKRLKRVLNSGRFRWISGRKGSRCTT